MPGSDCDGGLLCIKGFASKVSCSWDQIGLFKDLGGMKLPGDSRFQ